MSLGRAANGGFPENYFREESSLVKRLPHLCMGVRRFTERVAEKESYKMGCKEPASPVRLSYN